MGLAGSGWAEEHDVLFRRNEIQCSQMGDVVAFEGTLAFTGFRFPPEVIMVAVRRSPQAPGFEPYSILEGKLRLRLTVRAGASRGQPSQLSRLTSKTHQSISLPDATAVRWYPPRSAVDSGIGVW